MFGGGGSQGNFLPTPTPRSRLSQTVTVETVSALRLITSGSELVTDTRTEHCGTGLTLESSLSLITRPRRSRRIGSSSSCKQCSAHVAKVLGRHRYRQFCRLLSFVSFSFVARWFLPNFAIPLHFFICVERNRPKRNGFNTFHHCLKLDNFS